MSEDRAAYADSNDDLKVAVQAHIEAEYREACARVAFYAARDQADLTRKSMVAVAKASTLPQAFRVDDYRVAVVRAVGHDDEVVMEVVPCQ